MGALNSYHKTEIDSEENSDGIMCFMDECKSPLTGGSSTIARDDERTMSDLKLRLPAKHTDIWNLSSQLRAISDFAFTVRHTASGMTEMQQSLESIEQKLELMRIHLTVNNSSKLSNELAMMHWWAIKPSIKCSVIVFEIKGLDTVRESLGFSAMNECIQHALELLEDNQKWFEHETGGFVQVFHPSFAPTRIIVICQETVSENVKHLCRCFIGDAVKFVKVFPHGVKVAAGFAICRGIRSKLDLNLAAWYCRCDEALIQAWKIYQPHLDCAECVSQWMSPADRDTLGKELVGQLQVLDRLKENGGRVETDTVRRGIAQRIQQAQKKIETALKHGNLDTPIGSVGDSVFQRLMGRVSWSKLESVIKERPVDMDHQNDRGITPLMIACLRDAPESFLLEVVSRMKCPNLRDEHERSAMHYCVSKGQWKVLDKLRETGKFIDDRQSVISALRSDNVDTFFLEWRAIGFEWSTVIDPRGRTVIHYCAMHNAVHCLTAIFKSCDSYSEITELIDNNGNTPVALAVSKGNGPVTDVFISHGANTRIRNMEGLDCLDLARQGGHPSIERSLAIYHTRRIQPGQPRRDSHIMTSLVLRPIDSQNRSSSSSAMMSSASTELTQSSNQSPKPSKFGGTPLTKYTGSQMQKDLAIVRREYEASQHRKDMEHLVNEVNKENQSVMRSQAHSSGSQCWSDETLVSDTQSSECGSRESELTSTESSGTALSSSMDTQIPKSLRNAANVISMHPRSQRKGK